MKKELDPYRGIQFFYDGPAYQLKQGYMCTNASCSKDKIREMPINGHAVGQARKLFDKQLKLTELKIFDRFEEKEEFSERLAGFMHLGEEAEIPSQAQVDKFIELMHDAYVQSDNKHTVQPNIKGVLTGGDFLDKSEYWRLFMEENKTDKKKEEEAAKKKKDEEEKKKAEEKRKAEEKKKEEERKRVEEEEERVERATLEEKESKKKKYADKFGVVFNSSGDPYFAINPQNIPTLSLYHLKTVITRSIYEAVNGIFSHRFPEEYPLLETANNVFEWYNAAKNYESYVAYEEDIMSNIDSVNDQSGKARQEIKDIYDILNKMYDPLEEWGGYLDSVFTCFGRNIVRKKYGLEYLNSSYTFEEEIKEFMNSGKFNINDIEGSMKRLLLSFTDEDIKKYCEAEDLDEDDTNNLLELFKDTREQMGEGKGIMEISAATKDYMKKVGKNGGSRGVVRSITKTSSRMLAEFFAKKTGKKGKALSAVTETLQAVFESEEGRALVGIGLARIAPVICEKAGRPELGEFLREELDTESVSVVSEKATDLATAFGMMGISELLSMVKTIDSSEVDVSPKALSGSTVEPVPGMAREEELAGSGRRS